MRSPFLPLPLTLASIFLLPSLSNAQTPSAPVGFATSSMPADPSAAAHNLGGFLNIPQVVSDALPEIASDLGAAISAIAPTAVVSDLPTILPGAGPALQTAAAEVVEDILDELVVTEQAPQQLVDQISPVVESELAPELVSGVSRCVLETVVSFSCPSLFPFLRFSEGMPKLPCLSLHFQTRQTL